MTGEVGGFTPETEVHGSKRSRIRCIIMCVTLIVLVGLAVVVAFAIGYASDPPGLIVHPSDMIIFGSNIVKGPTEDELVASLNALDDSYHSSTSGSHLFDCRPDTQLSSGQECRFDLTWLGPDCNKANGWGYKYREPCILLSFNEPKDWVPEPYTSPSELPSQMPDSLRDHIQYAFETNSPTQMLWVSCTGEAPADTEYMGRATLTPWQGFPSYYFPVRQDTSTRGTPLLALRLVNVQSGVLLSIRCHFWAKNLQVPHVAARIEVLMD